MLLYGLAGIGLGVLPVVMLWPPSADVVFGALVWALGGAVMTAVGVHTLREPLRELRRREDRIWLDEADLWWVRHRPAAPGAEPERASRAEIAQVREVRLTRTGWLARSGRLDAVRIRARTGRQPADPRRVAALELGRGRWPGQHVLRAVLDAGESTVVTRGWNRRRIGALAAWLAGRADIPLSRDRATDRDAGPARAQRMSRKNARTSSISVAGSSSAAK